MSVIARGSSSVCRFESDILSAVDDAYLSFSWVKVVFKVSWRRLGIKESDTDTLRLIQESV